MWRPWCMKSQTDDRGVAWGCTAFLWLTLSLSNWKGDVRDRRRDLKITICCITKLSWPLICLGEWMSPNLLTLKGHIPAKSSQRDYYMSWRIGATASGLCFSEPGLHQCLWRWRPCCFQMPCAHGLLSFYHPAQVSSPHTVVAQRCPRSLSGRNV